MFSALLLRIPVYEAGKQEGDKGEDEKEDEEDDYPFITHYCQLDFSPSEYFV